MRHYNSLMLLVIYSVPRRHRSRAQTAAELMAEGNSLVRSGVYRTALLRYREAAAAGLDTPLLHYNLGVVHYELGDFAEAAAEFALATAEPGLGALASYNRGLALRAAGDTAAATEAFNAAADAADDRDLRRLAEDAAESATPPRARSRRAVTRQRRARRRRDRRAHRRAAAHGSGASRPRRQRLPYAGRALTSILRIRLQPIGDTRRAVGELHAGGAARGRTCSTTRPATPSSCSATTWTARSTTPSSRTRTEVDQRFSMGADIVLGESERRRRAVDTAFFVGSHQRDELRSRRRLGATSRHRRRVVTRTSATGSRIQAVGSRRASSRTRWAVSRGASTCVFERGEYERIGARRELRPRLLLHGRRHRLRLQRRHDAAARLAPVPYGCTTRGLRAT